MIKQEARTVAAFYLHFNRSTNKLGNIMFMVLGAVRCREITGKSDVAGELGCQLLVAMEPVLALGHPDDLELSESYCEGCGYLQHWSLHPVEVKMLKCPSCGAMSSQVCRTNRG